jgi:hypothetical protein
MATAAVAAHSCLGLWLLVELYKWRLPSLTELYWLIVAFWGHHLLLLTVSAIHTRSCWRVIMLSISRYSLYAEFVCGAASIKGSCVTLLGRRELKDRLWHVAGYASHQNLFHRVAVFSPGLKQFSQGSTYWLTWICDSLGTMFTIKAF